MRYVTNRCACPCHGPTPASRDEPSSCDLCAILHVEAPRRVRVTPLAGAPYPAAVRRRPREDSPYRNDDEGDESGG